MAAAIKKMPTGDKAVALRYLKRAEEAAKQGNPTMARAYISQAFSQYIRDGNTELDEINAAIDEMESKYGLK